LKIFEKVGLIDEVIGFMLTLSLSGKGDTEGFIFIIFIYISLPAWKQAKFSGLL
jgi:hypothetical protein